MLIVFSIEIWNEIYETKVLSKNVVRAARTSCMRTLLKLYQEARMWAARKTLLEFGHDDEKVAWVNYVAH